MSGHRGAVQDAVGYVASGALSGLRGVCGFAVACALTILAWLAPVLSGLLVVAGGLALLLCILFGWAHPSAHFSVSLALAVAAACFVLSAVLPYTVEGVVDWTSRPNGRS